MISLLFSFSSCQVVSYEMDLYPNQDQCLSEYYQEQTVVIYESVSMSHRPLQVDIRSPDGRIMFHLVNDTTAYSLTTPTSGYYTICYKNLEKYPHIFRLRIKSGVSANDYSSVAKTKDLSPIDGELDRLIGRENVLTHLNTKISIKQAEFNSIYDKISNKIIFYSVIMIIGMIAIGYLETFYLKRFLERRKII